MTAEQERAAVVRRSGGWFATGTEWSGPWRCMEAAERAAAGDFDGAWKIERAKPVKETSDGAQ